MGHPHRYQYLFVDLFMLKDYIRDDMLTRTVCGKMVSAEELSPIQESATAIEVKGPKKDVEIYHIDLEVYHQLDCLNLLRQAT
jgi:hypothetical protein